MGCILPSSPVCGWEGGVERAVEPRGPTKDRSREETQPRHPLPPGPLIPETPKAQASSKGGVGMQGGGGGVCRGAVGSQGGPEQGEGLRGVWGESPALGWHQATRVGRGDSRPPQAGMGAVGRLGLVHVSVSWLDN